MKTSSFLASTISMVMILLTLFGTVSCNKNKGFSAANSPCEGDNCSQKKAAEPITPEPPTPAPVPDLSLYPEILNYKGFMSGPTTANQLMIKIDTQQKSLIVRIPLVIPVQLYGDVVIDIPDLPGAFLFAKTDDAGLESIFLSIPLKYILKKVDFLNPEKLPNGDPLPGLPYGELPSLSMTLSKSKKANLHLYFGVGILAAYLSINKDPYIRQTYLIKNKDKTKVIGSFTLIPKKGETRGGLFVASTLTTEVSQILNQILF